jgi:hypothetical protein
VSGARVLGAVLVAILAVAAMPAFASGGERRVVGDCDHSQVRPIMIWISCNNPSFSLGQLRWSTFGGPSAGATGVMRLESCPASCSPDSVRDHPVALVFSHARRCPDGHADYRLADVAFSSWARPPGSAAKPTELVLFCPLTN